MAPDGSKQYIPCSPGDKGAFEATLITLAERGLAAGVQPPKICMRDFEKVSGRICIVQADLLHDDMPADASASGTMRGATCVGCCS